MSNNAVITRPGENLIAQKQANKEILTIDQFVLAYIPGLDPDDIIDRDEQLPPPSQIVLQDPVSQTGYINPNLVVYSLMLDTGGEKFDFNWIGLYSIDDDVVVGIAYLPTQSKDPSVAMTRNFVLEFSGAAETTDIHIDAESWQVDFSARMDGTDERVRQLSEDTIGRQLFYGDACKVSPGENGYYKVASGTGHVAGIRFNYTEKSVLVSKFPSSIWMDVCQKTNSMSDIEPEAVAVVSQTDRDDYTDGDGVRHYLEKVAEVESAEKVVHCRRLNKFAFVPRPDFYLPFINDIHIQEGVGNITFIRDSGGSEILKSGILTWRNANEPRFEYGHYLQERKSTNRVTHSNKFVASGNALITPVPNGAIDGKSDSYIVRGATNVTIDSINGHNIYKTILGSHMPSGITYCGWAYLKKVKTNSADHVDIRLTGDDQVSGFPRMYLTDKWQKGAKRTTRVKTGPTELLIFGNTNGDFEICFSQTEEGDNPTSYIPTEDSPITRLPDVVYENDSNSFVAPYTVFFRVDLSRGRTSNGNYPRILRFCDIRFEYRRFTDELVLIHEGQNKNIRFYSENTTSEYTFCATVSESEMTLYINTIPIGTVSLNEVSKRLNKFECNYDSNNRASCGLRDVMAWRKVMTQEQINFLG